MTWGGSYAGLQHLGASVIELAPPPTATPTPTNTATMTPTPTSTFAATVVANLCPGLNLTSLSLADTGLTSSDLLLADICGAGKLMRSGNGFMTL